MTSLHGSLLERMEDRSSIVSKLEDVEKVLKEIEDNTHPDRGNRSVFRREKVTVDIRTIIISVGDIDTVGQQFKCDFYLSATWKEPQLQEKGTKEFKWHHHWHPRIEFFNLLEIRHMERYHDLSYDEEKAIVAERYRIKGIFRQNFDLKDFPLDYQELTITLKSTWRKKQVKFQKDLRKMDEIETETFTAGQEWDLFGHVVTESKSIGSKTGRDDVYPLYNIKCHVKRKSGYYLWNIAMFIFLIYILSFCLFSVEISSPDRLTATLTLLLTAVAFKFVVSQSLPTISYLTLLDKYVLSCLVFLCCMATENAAVSALIPDPDKQKSVDRVCFSVGIACFLVIHIAALAFLIKKWRSIKKELADSKKHYEDIKSQVEKFQERKNSQPCSQNKSWV